jgi:hypothetical protein
MTNIKTTEGPRKRLESKGREKWSVYTSEPFYYIKLQKDLQEN